LALLLAPFPRFMAPFPRTQQRGPPGQGTGAGAAEGGRVTARRPKPIPPVAAPLQDTTCTCKAPAVIRTGDGKARCRTCAGIVERQGRLDTRLGGRR